MFYTPLILRLFTFTPFASTHNLLIYALSFSVYSPLARFFLLTITSAYFIISYGHVILGSSLFDLRLPFQCPRQLSPYNDWLRVGRSGNRVHVEARFSAPVQTGLGAHPASCTMGTRSFPGVKSGRGVTLTPHHLLVPLVMKEWSYTSTPPMGRTACTDPQCRYKGDLYLYLTLPFQEHD